jgi:hypothetical protein
VAVPKQVENKIIIEMRARRALEEKGIGGYYNRDNPSFVFVYAIASAPGGKFSAFRVDWRQMMKRNARAVRVDVLLRRRASVGIAKTAVRNLLAEEA